MASNPIFAPLISQIEANPGTSQQVHVGPVLQAIKSLSGINQLRGNAQNATTGQGIPKQVTSVGISVSNAAKGSTCAVSVTFQRDPSDSNYSGVTVFVKGYQGNNNPVQVGAGSTSPITFTLNNTGERVSFLVQSYGNSGNAPLSSAPTGGTTLPKSAISGFGSTTVTAYTPSSPPPSSTPSLPPPDYEICALWEPIGTGTFGTVNTFTALGDAAVVQSSGTVSAAALTSSSNLAALLTGNQFWFGNPRFYAGRNLTFKFAGGASNVVAGTAYQIFGLANSNTWAGGPPPTGAFALFNGTGGFWTCETGDGSSTTSVTTSIAVNSTRHHFEIDYTPSSVVFRIDGNTVATITTHLPSTQALAMCLVNEKSGSSTHTLTAEYLYAVQASE